MGDRRRYCDRSKNAYESRIIGVFYPYSGPDF